MAESDHQNTISTHESLEMAERVARTVEIVSSRLIDTSAHVALQDDELPKHINLGHRSHTEVDRAAGKIRAIVQFQFTASYIDEDDDDEDEYEHAPVLITADYVLGYELNQIDDYSDQELRAFGAHNGPYNAWPYWREYVYSMLSRMGLPPITLPVFRFTDRKEV